MLASDKKARNLIFRAKGVIFDFDGLLVDSEYYHYLAYNKAFAKYGHEIKKEEYWVYFSSKGLGPRGEIERYNLQGIDPDEIVAEKWNYFREFCKEGKIPLYNGAKKLLVALKMAGVKMCVASATNGEDVETVLIHHDIASFFEFVVGKSHVQNNKPYPDLFLLAAKKLKLEPEECLVLEDAEKGLVAANRAHIPCILVRNAINYNLDLPMADAEVPDLETLARYVEGHD